MGAQLGAVLDVGLYEFPKNAKIVKVKILFNVNNPIRAGMYIGNNQDGISWVDFRYQNLPMWFSDTNNFNDTLNACDLTNLAYHGKKFTWTNNQVDQHNIKERLDRFCVNSNWINFFPKYINKKLFRYTSDHSPILL